MPEKSGRKCGLADVAIIDEGVVDVVPVVEGVCRGVVGQLVLRGGAMVIFAGAWSVLRRNH